MRGRAGIVAALAVVLAVVLGACSSGAPAEDPVAAVRGAVVATRAAGTAQIAFSSRTGPPGQPGVEVSGSGPADLAAPAADVAVNVPLLGGSTRVLLVAGTLYAQLPPTLVGLVPGGRPWASISLQQLSSQALGASLGPFGGAPGDPLQQLAYLDGVTEARAVGPEPVDGTPTTHYAAVVDLTTTPAAKDPATRPAVDRLAAEVGSTRLPVDVWVGEDGRIRRLTQTTTSAPRDGAPATASTTEVTLAQYGIPVTVIPPPADQVTDVGALLPSR
jgi:hypothetical protein